MKKVDRSFVGSELFEKRPVVGCGVGDGNQFGPHLADMSDLFGELRRCLAGFRPKTERFLPSASWKLTVPQDAQHASSSPSGRSGTPSSETAHGFAGFRLAVHGFLLRFLPETARRTSAWLDDGFMPPSSPKSLAVSRGVQWFRRAAAGFSAIVDRRERVLARPEDRTAWVFCVRAARTLPSSRTGPPLSSRRICTTRHSATTPRPRNRRTRLSRLVPSLTKVANAPNALAVAAPFSTMDAKARTASAATGESFERDKP